MKKNIKAIIYLIITMWIIFLLQHIVKIPYYGIIPRKTSGLAGIPLSIFFHGNYTHIISNTIGMAIFGLLSILSGVRRPILIMLNITLIQGSLTWLLARPGIHIGVSGLIFGLYGHLIFQGYFQRNLRTVIISLFVIIFYGGMILGVLPTKSFISWEGHLFGVVAGFIVAFKQKKKTF